MTKIKNVFNKGVAKVKELAMKAVKGDSHFVAVLVVIVVCIGLAIIFKGQIETFFTSIMAEATLKTQGLF